MMLKTIRLPKLNHLTPTLDSTLLKAMEEAGELARAVLKFLPDEENHSLLQDVAEELLDVAQTCVTMFFVMEDSFQINADTLISEHLLKLQHKGYVFDTKQQYFINTENNYKYLNLPQLKISKVSLLTTVCKIQEELGELTQYLGKRAGASGEKPELSGEEALNGCALELLDVAQCCFTMMYILAQKYGIDIDSLVKRHIDKLRRKGYCT